MTYDPYEGNILTNGLGPILDRNEIYKSLIYTPKKPPPIHNLSKLERLHCLGFVRDLHIPSLEGARIYETIDLILRQSYRYRDPHQSKTWAAISGETNNLVSLRSPAMAALTAGHSGTGKTQSIHHALSIYPQQVIIHDNFPNIVGVHPQIVWLSVDVPASGKAEDLAANLMQTWDDTLSKYIPGYVPRFESSLSKDRRNGGKMLDEWRQVALTNCFGVLHLDEIQNFFKLATLKQRRNRKNPTHSPELSIVEDKCLRWILSLLNTWGVPVVMSGTLDGVGALTKRLSTIQRISTGGYHKLTPFSISSNEFSLIFKELVRYQYVKKPLPDSKKFRQLIIELTAGVPRIIGALWFSAHRVAFERKEDSLTFDDFIKAANTLLAPLKPAVSALNSGDPVQMARYDDLIPKDDAIWSSFWSPSINV